MGSSSSIQTLIMLFAAMVTLLFILIIALVIVRLRRKKAKDKKVTQSADTEIVTKDVIAENYSRQPIFSFLDFDKVEDNMIIQKSGSKYLMVIQCQGVNYDLMSAQEKVAVEAGFVQFLNTLRHSIQIYIQTRTVNLESSISTYQKRVRQFEERLNKLKIEYQQMLNSGKYSRQELDKKMMEITKQTNLCEYGRDVIYNTEKMSLNRNVLNKQYYIIVPYYPTDLGTNNFDKEEIQSIAFSELYTKAQSIVRSLSACEVSAKILTSNELVDLLYVTYNRDDSEIFGVDKAYRAGFEELYSTAKDVLDKKMRVLNKRIEEEARELVNAKILEVKSEKEKQLEEKEAKANDLINEMARIIIEENKMYIGEDVADSVIQKIEKEQELKKGSEVEDVGEKEKPKTRTRARRIKKSE